MAFAHLHVHTENSVIRRIINQMGRELLLLQSSDWPFIMKMGTMVDYAEKRVRIHTNLFFELTSMLSLENFKEDRLKEIEEEHPGRRHRFTAKRFAQVRDEILHVFFWIEIRPLGKVPVRQCLQQVGTRYQVFQSHYYAYSKSVDG